MPADDGDGLPLRVLYDRARAAHAGAAGVSADSEAGRRRIESALAAVDAASAAVAAAAVLPSRGETADDVAAGDLKYLVLPAWRGDLLSAAAPPSRPDPAARERALRRAAAEWRAFLGDAAACGAVPRSAAAGAGGDDDDDAAADPAAKRAAKIAAYRRRKQLEAAVAGAGAAAASDDDDDGDGDAARRGVLALLELAALDAAAAAAAADAEAGLLEHAAETGLAAFAEREVADARARGAREAAAAAARAARGTDPEPDGGPNLAAARAMDDWKDDHPYGYGDSKKRPTATGS